MDLGGIRSLYLPLRPKARFSPGRKTPPSVSTPSAGLWPLNISRVKCGGGPCRGHSVLPCAGNMICLHCAFMNGARFDICLRKHAVAATGPSPFKVRDNPRPERTMSGVRKPTPESSVPGDNLPGEVGGINCGGDMGVRRCLARSLTSLAFRCALQRVQTVPAAIHSGRIPPPQPTSHGDGRLSHLPHHTGHGPFRTRPPTSVKSPFRIEE